MYFIVTLYNVVTNYYQVFSKTCLLIGCFVQLVFATL